MKQHMLKELIMSKTTPEQNKALLVEAFDTLFNKRDYTAAERFWSPKYIQHSSHIEMDCSTWLNQCPLDPSGNTAS
jgi:hypothetical protein